MLNINHCLEMRRGKATLLPGRWFRNGTYKEAWFHLAAWCCRQDYPLLTLPISPTATITRADNTYLTLNIEDFTSIISFDVHSTALNRYFYCPHFLPDEGTDI